jgi:transcriptional regulator with XRE-family HTH domain
VALLAAPSFAEDPIRPNPRLTPGAVIDTDTALVCASGNSKSVRHTPGQLKALSDAEVAGRAGLTERRYGNYVAGIREPDLATLVNIARALSTTPNHLLGVEAPDVPRSERDRCRARLPGTIDRLSADDLERLMVQVEALSRHRGKGRRA